MMAASLVRRGDGAVWRPDSFGYTADQAKRLHEGAAYWQTFAPCLAASGRRSHRWPYKSPFGGFCFCGAAALYHTCRFRYTGNPLTAHAVATMTLAELMAQKAAIETSIQELRASERSDAIANVRALMAEHGLTTSDLATAKAPRASGSLKGVAIAAKYRGPAGETWTGRGMQPRWLKAALAHGASADQFRVAA